MPDREQTQLEGFVDAANAVDEVFATMRESKAGYKTTEFWITLLGVLGTQIGTLDIPAEYGAVLAAAYVLSRGVAKAGQPSIAS